MKKNLTLKIISIMIAVVLSFALLGLSGCDRGDNFPLPIPAPQWRTDAVEAFRNARFAPELEDVVPGFFFYLSQIK